VIVPAVAVNVAVVLEDPTVTEAGTVSVAALLDSATVAPPVFDTVAVHVELAPEAKLVGEHVMELNDGEEDADPVMTPPAPVTEIAVPLTVAPKVFVTPIVVLATPEAMVTLTTATTPFCMTFEFRPASRQK